MRDLVTGLQNSIGRCDFRKCLLQKRFGERVLLISSIETGDSSLCEAGIDSILRIGVAAGLRQVATHLQLTARSDSMDFQLDSERLNRFLDPQTFGRVFALLQLNQAAIGLVGSPSHLIQGRKKGTAAIIEVIAGVDDAARQTSFGNVDPLSPLQFPEQGRSRLL